MSETPVAELEFVTDTNTINRIIKTGFFELSRDEFLKERQISTGSSPTRFFKKTPFGEGFAHVVATLSVNDRSGEVAFYWYGTN